MSVTQRNPTHVAPCGCPYDPEYDEGSLGWHLCENHPEVVVDTPVPVELIRRAIDELDAVWRLDASRGLRDGWGGSEYRWESAAHAFRRILLGDEVADGFVLGEAPKET